MTRSNRLFFSVAPSAAVACASLRGLLLLLAFLAVNPAGLLKAQDVYQGTFQSRTAIVRKSQKCEDRQTVPDSTTTPTLTAFTTSLQPDAATLAACSWGSFTGATFTFDAPSSPLSGTLDGFTLRTSFQSTTSASANVSVTYTGSTVRADRRAGNATVNVDNRYVVRGGTCDEQGTGFQIEGKAFGLQPGSGTFNLSASCTAVGFAIDQESIRREGSRIVEFTAASQNQGGFGLSIGENDGSRPYGVSWSAFVRTTYRFVLGTAPTTDDVSLSSVLPAAATLIEGSTQQFSGTAKVTVGTAAQGAVTLELRDQTGKTIATSAASQVNRGTSDVALVIPSLKIPSATSLTLRAVLKVGTSVKESTPVTYPVASGDACLAAKEAPGRAAAGCSLRIDTAVPRALENIFAVADFLPPFCATGDYIYKGTRDAEIVLVVSLNGQTLGISQPQLVVPGTQQRWGGDCFSKPLTFIEEQPMPPFTIPSGTKSDELLGVLKLQAVLRDYATKTFLTTSNPVVYGVVPGVTWQPKLWAHGFRDESQPTMFKEFDPKTNFVHSGQSFEKAVAGSLLGDVIFPGADIRGLMDFFGSEATVGARFRAFDGQGNILSNDLTVHEETVGLGKTNFGVGQFNLFIDGNIPAGTASTVITPELRLRSGQTVSFDVIKVSSDGLAVGTIVPDPAACSLSQPLQCLTKGAANTIKVGITATTPLGGYGVFRRASFSTDALADYVAVRAVTAGETLAFIDEFQVAVPADPSPLYVEYALKRPGDRCSFTIECPMATIIYENFISQIFQLGNIAGNAVYNFSGGSLAGFQTNVNKQIRNVKGSLGLVNRFPNAKKDFDNWLKTAAENPSYLAIPTTWSFDPPIPRDGTFSARLTLKYKASDLPVGDPNFAEGRLQIVSVDANGALRSYPTTLDVVNKTASAQIDSLDPDYSLAVMGPFAQSGVFLTNAENSFVQVNTGATDANLRVTPFTPAGQGTEASSTLRGANAGRVNPASPGPAWLQSWTTLPAVEGVSWVDKGALFAVNPGSSPGVRFLFPGVVYAARKTTVFSVANVSWAPARVRVNLMNPDGTAKGTYNIELGAKGSFGANIENLFPTLAKGFSGYAVIASTQNVVASGRYVTASSASGLVGISMTEASAGAATKFAMRPGETGGAASLRLVNLGTATARLTLRARTAAGTAAGNPVTVDLAAGRQYDRPVADIFSVAADTVASVQVDGAANVLGDLLTADGGFIPVYSVSLPLVSEGKTASALPFTTGDTTVYVYNPNASAATATATPIAADGTKGTASTESIPAFGRAPIGVGSAAGYLNISASQPVLAAGWLTNSSGNVTGYLAVNSATQLPLGSPGAKPAASAAGVLNAASFQGGGVAPGEIVTIFGSNVGPPELARLALAANGRVANFLGATRVLFDGVPAPIVYVLAGQTSVVVPYSVAGRSTTEMVVEYQGRRSDPVTLNVTAAAPGLFSLGSGTGQGAILNQDSKVNGASNPAAKGSVVVFFGTGDGTEDPDVPDGNVNAAVFPKPRQPVGMTIGGVPAEVVYAGAAPGFVAGVMQVNAIVPANAPSGNAAVVLTVGDTRSQSGLTLAIAGTAVPAPLIAASLSSVDFGNVAVGQTKDLTVTVRNLGNATLTVNSVTSSLARFSVTNPAVPFSVASGGSQAITIRFTPNAAGAVTGTLSIVSNDASQSPLPVALAGSGGTTAAPAVGLGTGSLDFGTVTVAQTKDLTLAVNNTGTATLTVSSIISSSARFTVVTPAAPFSVAAGTSQTVTIRFSPTAAGAQTGTLSIASNDAGKPTLTVALSGSGSVAAAPSIGLGAVSLDFGNVTLAQTKDLTLAVSNTGTATLTVSSVASSNTRFSVVTAAPFNIAPGTSQTITIRFTPLAAGAQAGTLTLASNDASRPQAQVSLSGAGVASGSTPTIAIGQSLAGTLTTSSAKSVSCPTCFAATYKLTVTVSQLLDVRANSTAFDAYLVLLDAQGRIVAEDDDTGGGTNARLIGTFAPGDYFIEVTTAFEGETGGYTISVTATR